MRHTKVNKENEATRETAVEWTAADFGFRACLIFRVDILGETEEGAELGFLLCSIKDADTGTIVADRKRHTQLHPNGPPPQTYLSPSIENRAVGLEDDLAMGRGTSLPSVRGGRNLQTREKSTRNLEKRLQEIHPSANAVEWRRLGRTWLEAKRQTSTHPSGRGRKDPGSPK